MNTYHEEEMIHLICQQWETQALLNDADLSLSDRKELQEQFVTCTYHMAQLVDLYQNRLIMFQFKGKYYNRYSEVIKDLCFDLKKAHKLLVKVFELQHISQMHTIRMEDLGEAKPQNYQAFLAYVPQEV